MAAFCVLGLMLLIYLLPRFSAKSATPLPITADAALAKMLDTLQRQPADGTASADNEEVSLKCPYEPSQPLGFTESELFAFDPNTLYLQKAGISWISTKGPSKPF